MTQFSEGYFKTFDSHRLYFQSHRIENPKAALIVAHGLNEHSGRYGNVISYFTEHGYNVHLLDHRGHGKSDGARSDINNFDDFIRDLWMFVKKIRAQEKGLPLFLIGHSMGGQIVLNFTAEHGAESGLSGILTSSANVEVAIPLNFVKVKAAHLLTKVTPSLQLPNDIDPKWICRDPEVVRAYKKDALISKKITVRLASQILRNQTTLLEKAKRITLPVFLMHAGDDHICAAAGSQKFNGHLASKDKTLKIYPEMYHEIFNEFGKEEVFSDMDVWMKKRL